MTELDSIICNLCKREEDTGCYNITIDGIGVYNLIRFKVRNDFLQSKGYNFVEKYSGVKLSELIKSLFISAFQLAKIRVLRRKYDVFFYAFLRLDHVGGSYLDKYVDPVIDCCGAENYIIFERGRRGVHFKPRVHAGRVVYTNLLDVYFDVVAKLGCKRFAKKYRQELTQLFSAIEIVLEGEKINRENLTNFVLYCICRTKTYEKIFRRMGVKKIFAPSRANILSHICAAKRLGIESYEFQHGITYGETAIYSGYRDPNYTPDGFLAFGDTPPRDVYGIDESKIYNIGWAFQEYIDQTEANVRVAEKDVLVISGPCMTDKILSATFKLAKDNPDIHFVVRPHPAEVVSDENKKDVSEYPNIVFQDPKINVAVAMRPFQNLIGENSTVLYEALTYGKKVARFCFEGFNPRYLTPKDEECFWKVCDSESFKAFINGKVEDKKSMKIYSKFDKELFLKLYNS